MLFLGLTLVCPGHGPSPGPGQRPRPNPNPKPRPRPSLGLCVAHQGAGHPHPDRCGTASPRVHKRRHTRCTEGWRVGNKHQSPTVVQQHQLPKQAEGWRVGEEPKPPGCHSTHIPALQAQPAQDPMQDPAAPNHDVENLCRELPDRIQDVIDAEGGRISK